MAFQEFVSTETPTYPFAKDPSEKLDYSFDFNELAGEVVMSDPTVTVNDDDVAITNVILADGVVSCFAAGGTNQTYCVLSFGVELADGRNLQRDMRLRIENR